MKLAKRILTLGLAMALCVQLLPAQALAHLQEGAAEKPTQITTAEGKTVEVEESWEDLYPYGVFLFAQGEAHVTEGGEAVLIPLYRLGGTQGRATALVNYNPSIMQLEEGVLSYGNAAGSGDVRIEVEDPLPIAAYQPLGKPSEPAPTGAKLVDSPYTGEGAQPGDHVLTVDAPADAFQWYVLSEGRWQVVEDATAGEFVVAGEMLDRYDFRCVLTQAGSSFCTDSLKGEVYVPEEEEELPEMPEDLDLTAEQTFSTLDTDPEDPYAGYVFAVTFADGEWVKEIRVTAPEDEKAEALKFGTFTLIDHLGGDVFSGAATLTLSVTDNDDPEPFTIGFTAQSYEARRSEGTAELRLKRTGGTQTMVTVDYATQDGTAIAGRDYQTTTGTAAFYAGVDEAVIRVPLVDRESSEPLTFQVQLGEVKGDSQYLCTLDTTVAQVTVTGGGKRPGQPNLATLLYDAQAVDLSGSVQTAETVAPVEGGVVTGQAAQIPAEELLRADIADLDSPAAQDQGQLMTYSYGRITFPYNDSENYWGDEAHIAGTSNNDVTNWSGGSASGQGWQIQGRSPASATLRIPYMSQMYTGFNGKFEFNAKLASSWTLFWYGMEYVYGSAALVRKNGFNRNTTSSSPTITKDGVEKSISYSTSGTIKTTWGLGDDVSGLKLWLAHYDAHDADDTVYSRITRGDLPRRVMGGDMSLRVHTANDGESGGGNVVTAPEGAASLRSGSGVYNSMKPQVTVVPRSGGTDWRGRLYVGSRIQVSLSSTDSYKPYGGSALNSALYLTRSDGSLVTGPQIEKCGSDFYITMVWEGMTEADLNENYIINVVMTRTQELELDISPSVPRKPGVDGPSQEIDISRVSEGWADFLATGKPYITLGYSEAVTQAPHFTRQMSERNIDLRDLLKEKSVPLCSLGSYENLQYINFNRSSEDWIILNGKQYRGDERIWLTVEDLAFGKLRFLCYAKAYLDVESTMTASVNRVELYFDGDGDGKISGAYNADTGYFNLSDGTEDRFVMMLESDKSYSEITFQPEKLPNGNFGEYYLKIFYTMTPRSLTAPQGKGGAVAQVLPALITSVTDQAVYSTLTEEQQSYRYLLSGLGEGGDRTSDGHPMYGVEANRAQFVDVPLGGDHSPVEHEGSETTGYTFHWEPQFRGNLLYPFTNPEPIYITHSLAGDNVPLAQTSYNKAKGAMETDSKGRENLNGYLGSFVADTTLALCITQQTQTQDQLRADPRSAETLKPESTELIRRSAAPDPSYLGQVQSGGMGETSLDPGDSGDTYAEMLPDFGTDLPMRTFGLLGYATVMTNKDEVILSVSIPIATKTKVNDGAATNRTFPDTVTVPQGKQWNEVAGFLKSIKDGGDTTAVTDALKNNGHKALESGALKSRKLSATLSVTMVFSWKYDPVTNDYQFREFAAGVVGSLAFKYTYRFAFFPLAYFYVSVNFSLTVTTGGTVVRTELERDTPYIQQYRACPLRKNDVFGFYTRYQNVKIQFSGKIYVEVLDSKDATTPRADANNGYLRSSGGKTTTIRLSNTKSMEFDSEKYVRITALEDTTITYLNVIEKSYSDLVWSGVTIAPKFSLEVGVGAGVEFLKIEACVKIVASATILFGKYNEKDGSRSGAVFQAAKFAFSIVVRAVVFGFSAEMDAVGFTISYTDGKGWSKSYTLLDDVKPLSDGEPEFLRPPQDFTSTQRIFSPARTDEASLQAFQPDDPAIPFQLSGYNSSVSAFRLVQGLAMGCDYQVIPVKGENYVLYTMGREDPAGTLDRTMLALSRLVTTGGGSSTGLVNPLDPIHPAESTVLSPVPYLLVDTAEGEDDGTGDLEFQGWLDPDGKTIRVAWVSYVTPGDPEGVSGSQELLRAASQNTVIKTASFDTTQTTGFTPAQVVSQRTGGRVSMPAALGENLTAYVQAVPMTQEERDQAVQTYREALAAMGFDPDSPDPAVSSMGRYRLGAQETLWDGMGKQSALCVNAGGVISSLQLPEGQVVDNMAFAQAGDTYYGAFTTRETHFPTTPLAQGEGKNILTIRRLFLTSFTVSGTEVAWGSGESCLLLRTLYDYEDNSSLQDGLYSGGGITPYQEPYFANLQFLRANLGEALGGEPEQFELMDDQPESFLLFEMNGCTYLIRQADLESITGPNRRGSILPFFAVDTDFQGTAQPGAASATGRSEVTIGADGEGGLAAVYVATAPNTTNTALCLSKYDRVTGSWGKGVILAMNHMDVYEDSVREGWTPEETEAAYLGQREDYPRGSMDQFTFSAPQIALGVRGGQESGSSESYEASSEGSQTTLLVLTQGVGHTLRWEEADGERFLVLGDSKGMGLYALSYGVGHQTLGEASLGFLTRDFTAGAALHANLSFTNTGDVGIRGSDSQDQAITVTLSADGSGLPDTRLMSWTITENIAPGQKVALEGDFVLPVTLPEGAKFNLTVSEGNYYESQGGIPYTATLSGLLTVEGKPELGFENAAFQLSGLSSGAVTLDDRGNVSLDVDFLAGNRGNRDAEGVYVQFTCATGETDQEGDPVYRALDISRNTLEVGQEEPLLMSQQEGHDFSQGILFLGDLRTGYGRRVHGTITFSPDQCFVGQSGLLGLRAELFSDGDSQVTTDERGVRQGVHGEYNVKNNLFQQNVEPVVTFTLPDQIFLTKNAVVRLPIHYLSATGSRTPLVQVAESPDKEDTDGRGYSRFQNMDQCLDLLYYEPRSYDQGRGVGTIVLRAIKEGNGYIRVMDQTTNSYRDVLFTVTGESGGMYARPDNGRLTFYNRDGSVYQPERDQSTQDWRYEYAVGKDGTVPEQDAYRVVDGRVGSWFTFETEAEAITLYMDGEADVSSDFPGFQTKKVAVTDADTEKESGSAFVHFGPNPENQLHRVTVRVTNGQTHRVSAKFHRIVEHYGSDSVGDGTEAPNLSPKLYWRESFPKARSLSSNQTYHMYLNVVSALPLADVSVAIDDGRRWSSISPWGFGSQVVVPHRQSDYWSQADFVLQRNCTVTVTARDIGGNVTVQEVKADWWQSDSYNMGISDDWFSVLEDTPKEEVSRTWLTAEYVDDPEPVLRVQVEESAPYEDVILFGGDLDTLLWFSDLKEEEMTWSDLMRLHLHFGTRGSEFFIPAEKDGLYMVFALCESFASADKDPEYAAEIIRSDGTVEEYNALAQEDFNLLILQVGGETPEDQQEEDASDTSDDWSELPLEGPSVSGGGSGSGGGSVSGGQTQPEPAARFSDVAEDAWYYDSVRYVQEKGIMNGRGDGTFAPDEVTDRAMIAQVLWNLEGRPDPDQAVRFEDVDSRAWYVQPVLWAASQGIMGGTGENRFSPQGSLTREQLVTILYRYGRQKGLDTSRTASLTGYTDAQSISPWASEAMAWAVGVGLVNGKTPSTLNPADTATRAEVAAILMRYCETIAK